MRERRKRDPEAVRTFPRHDHDDEGRDAESRPSAFPLDVRHITQIEVRDGPIPDAQELARYSCAHPDAPEIILREFASQGAHRRLMERRESRLEKEALQASVQSERLGLACALFISLVGFGCATYLVMVGHGVEGTVIFGLDVCALVSAFILGRSRMEHLGPRRGDALR